MVCRWSTNRSAGPQWVILLTNEQIQNPSPVSVVLYIDKTSRPSTVGSQSRERGQTSDLPAFGHFFRSNRSGQKKREEVNLGGAVLTRFCNAGPRGLRGRAPPGPGLLAALAGPGTGTCPGAILIGQIFPCTHAPVFGLAVPICSAFTCISMAFPCTCI